MKCTEIQNLYLKKYILYYITDSEIQHVILYSNNCYIT